MKRRLVTLVIAASLIPAFSSNGYSRQKVVVTIPGLFSDSAVVILGRVERIEKHKDPGYEDRFQRVMIRAERILKRAEVSNPYVNREIVSGELIPVVIHAVHREKYQISTRGIWFIRYYNNTLWSNDPEIVRPVENLKEVEALSMKSGSLAPVEASAVPPPALSSAALAVGNIAFLKERFSSDLWQVRYGLLDDLSHRTLQEKELLLHLIYDENKLVANQALTRYLNDFALVDLERVRPRLRNVVPVEKGEGDDILSVPFYVAKLDSNVNNPRNDIGIRYIGVVGKRADESSLLPFQNSDNPYVLYETAKALIRLGDRDAGLKSLRKILSLGPKDNLYYQTLALYVMNELDARSARREYDELQKKVSVLPDIQPNWLNAHFIQGREFEVP